MKLNDLREAAEARKEQRNLISVGKQGLGKHKGKLDYTNLGLTSLIGSYGAVDGDFTCASSGDPYVDDRYKNAIISLEDGPVFVTGSYNCSGNRLKDLKGAPKLIGNYFDCHSNLLKSLEEAPTKIGGFFDASNNNLTSLKDVHKHIHEINGSFNVIGNLIKSHVLGVLYIKGCNKIQLAQNNELRAIQDIMNKYLSHDWVPNHEKILECKFKLVDAGFDEFAKL